MMLTSLLTRACRRWPVRPTTVVCPHNQLTRLPESITGLFRGKRKSGRQSFRLNAPCRRCGRSPARQLFSPVILFRYGGSLSPREARALHLAAAGWLVPSAREGEPAPADRWHMFGQEDNAAAFSPFPRTD
ncbi:hypothetical protein KCP71_17550 [Salmonella enterica subsp. enterica]|nr:hypothetical protein KCP71_17550 [Salmonella enterica subsp. enterica]